MGPKYVDVGHLHTTRGEKEIIFHFFFFIYIVQIIFFPLTFYIPMISNSGLTEISNRKNSHTSHNPRETEEMETCQVIRQRPELFR